MSSLIAPPSSDSPSLATTAGQAQDATSPSHVPAITAKAVSGHLIANFTIRDQAMYQKSSLSDWKP
jgi:hypothetical protein